MNYAHQKSIARGLIFQSPLGDIVETIGESEPFDYCKTLFKHKVMVIQGVFRKKGDNYFTDLDTYRLYETTIAKPVPLTAPSPKNEETSLPLPSAADYFYSKSLYA